MFAKMKMKSLLLLALTLVFIGWGVETVGAATQAATGIWLYDTGISISVVNMTDYTLKWKSTVQTYGKDNDVGPFYDGYGNFYSSVNSYRTKTWRSDSSSSISPSNWSGDLTFTLDTVSDGYSVQIHFVQQSPANALAGDGCWVSLRATNSSSSPYSTSTNAWVNNRWATPTTDNKMHNVMTLISDAFVVSLYSPDNKNITLILQQNYSSTYGSDVNIWGGYKNDWVDNDGYSVPGQ